MKIEFYIGYLEEKSLSKWISNTPENWSESTKFNHTSKTAKVTHYGREIVTPIEGNEFVIEFSHHPTCAHAFAQIIMVLNENCSVRLFHNMSEGTFYFATPMSVEGVYAIAKSICGDCNFIEAN